MFRRRALYLAAAALCALLGLAWQALVVYARYGGNWTALYCTGLQNPVPQALAAEQIYVFPNSRGYDGQFYHYVAHDPFIRTDIWRSIDLAPRRYRRILLPAVAFVLAFGKQSRIDAAYVAANLIFLLLGTWWLSRYLHSLKLQPWLAAFLVLAPATLISLDRLTVDLAFAALAIGFALYMRLGRDAETWTVLMLLCLCRETGFLIVAAVCLALALQHRFAKAVLFGAAVAPTSAWYLYVGGRIPSRENFGLADLVPLKGIFGTIVHPFAYHVSPAIDLALTSLDRLALLGFLAAAALSIWLLRRNPFGEVEAAMLLLTILGLCLTRAVWEESFAGPRMFTPLLLWVFLTGFPTLRWRALVPVLLVLPRVLLQVAAPLLFAMGLQPPR